MNDKKAKSAPPESITEQPAAVPSKVIERDLIQEALDDGRARSRAHALFMLRAGVLHV